MATTPGSLLVISLTSTAPSSRSTSLAAFVGSARQSSLVTVGVVQSPAMACAAVRYRIQIHALRRAPRVAVQTSAALLAPTAMPTRRLVAKTASGVARPCLAKTQELAALQTIRTVAVRKVSRAAVQKATRCVLGTTSAAQTDTICVATSAARMVLRRIPQGTL